MPNIPSSKDNQTMKLGQLIEHNMKSIFLEKLYTKCGGEASPRPFYRKSKFSTSLDQQSEMLTFPTIKFDFILCPSRRLPKH